MISEHDRFVQMVLSNPVNRAVLARGCQLGVPDWWLTAGAVHQTVWNVLDGRPPSRGITDYDLIYFDPADRSWEAEDRVIRRAADLFADLGAAVEVRNQARVHLWYEAHFGAPGIPFTDSCHAIHHFPSTTACFGLHQGTDGAIEVYAPHGYADLFDRRVRPNTRLAKQAVYEEKTARWAAEWPSLTIDPWPLSPGPTPPSG